MNSILFFLSGILIGAILETMYRSAKIKTFVLPHSLSVLMYGCTAVFLFFLKKLNIPVVAVAGFSIIFTTGIELIIFHLYRKLTGKQLWDYSNQKWNYKGAICLKFSLYWLLVSMFYYFLILPFLIRPYN